MKVAFSFLEDRIAPVFDTAERILVAEVEGTVIRSETVAKLTAEQSLERARSLSGMGVDILVCGAISAELQRFLTTQGLRVIPFVAGNMRDIIQAWLQGRLDTIAYRMPGCRQHRRSAQEGHAMNQEGRRGGRSKGQQRGCGSRQGDQGQSPEHGPGRRGSGPTDDCLCPTCGHREPHEHGNPCHHKLCPECGTAMTRETPFF